MSNWDGSLSLLTPSTSCRTTTHPAPETSCEVPPALTCAQGAEATILGVLDLAQSRYPIAAAVADGLLSPAYVRRIGGDAQWAQSPPKVASRAISSDNGSNTNGNFSSTTNNTTNNISSNTDINTNCSNQHKCSALAGNRQPPSTYSNDSISDSNIIINDNNNISSIGQHGKDTNTDNSDNISNIRNSTDLVAADRPAYLLASSALLPSLLACSANVASVPWVWGCPPIFLQNSSFSKVLWSSCQGSSGSTGSISRSMNQQHKQSRVQQQQQQQQHPVACLFGTSFGSKVSQNLPTLLTLNKGTEDLAQSRYPIAAAVAGGLLSPAYVRRVGADAQRAQSPLKVASRAISSNSGSNTNCNISTTSNNTTNNISSNADINTNCSNRHKCSALAGNRQPPSTYSNDSINDSNITINDNNNISIEQHCKDTNTDNSDNISNIKDSTDRVAADRPAYLSASSVLPPSLLAFSANVASLLWVWGCPRIFPHK